ncbi:DUF4785 domain-containing protein [Shewanella violacea]|uniref:Lipoprotein n=1 Tax=Shewanella violacea (strain JCM 10179 / CIP 106290 / LMG 19151 / DSS12) TaxID=637905 RepID=D4ZGD8_SHEVD|nr:DUF4785 domain-containing protein [Shewanella violacea]BAJ00737.1 conserved hypothetical protein [Shewanella violacea DSS12]
MKNYPLMLVTLAISTLLAGCQDETTTKAPDTQATSVKQVSLSAPQLGDFSVTEVTEPQLPPINSSRESLSFISVPTKTFTISPPSDSHSSTSDEYWTTVTGAELNRGISLAISQASSIIRISPRADLSSGFLMHSQAISPHKIQLINLDEKSGASKSSANIHSLVDPQALATAGLTDDSSALTMPSNAKPGKYQLKVSEPLGAKSSYLVNVKEKHSPYQLKLTSKFRVSSQSRSLDFNISLTNSDQQLRPTASLKHSDGSYLALKLVSDNGQWQAQLPESLTRPSSNLGLSEIQINMQTRVNGIQVIRTVKTAFKQFVPSAKIQQQVNTRWLEGVPVSIDFTLDIAEEGRFSLSGYLTGSDASGQDRTILKTESANWLTLDNSSIQLKLDPKLVKQSGLSAPFKLMGLELKDQGQMARLSYQQEALILEQ